jgi:SWI5-dependent HO expression protein 3
MYRRRVATFDRKMAEKDELTTLNAQNTAEGMIEVKLDSDIEADIHHGCVITSDLESNDYGTFGSSNVSNRGIIGDATGNIAKNAVSEVAAGICGGCMDKILMVISTILGVMVIIGGGLLAYQGTVAAVGFNYVLWTFAGIEFVAGIYIIFRTFSLASAMAQLRKINSEFEETQEKLEDEVDKMQGEVVQLHEANSNLQHTKFELQNVNLELQSTNSNLRLINSDLMSVNSQLQNVSADLTAKCENMREVILELSSETETLKQHANKLGAQIDLLAGENAMFTENNETYKHENANLHGQINRFINAEKEFEAQIGELRHERTELALANDKLRTAISALVSANDSSIDVGKMIAGVLKDMERERDALTNEREAMERFSIQLSSAIFAEMDLNGDSKIDAAEQSAWLAKIKK